MKNIIRRVLLCFSLVLLMSHNVGAVELTSNVTLVRGSYRGSLDYTAVSGFGNNCSRTSNYLIGGGGNETPCYLSSVTIGTWDGYYNVGDYIVQELYVHNTAVNNSSDVLARINSYSIATTGNAGADLVDVKFESLNDASGKISFISRVWQAGNIYNIRYGFEQYAAFGLFNAEWLASGFTSIWHENNGVDYSTTLNNINSVLGGQSQALQNIVDNTYFTHQDTASINTNTGVISGNVADIKSLVNSLGQKLDDLPENTADAVTEKEEEKVQEKADEAEQGANDAKAQTQQATSSLLSTVTGVFNAIINASATNCKFDSHLPFMSGNGTIDLCSIPAPPIVQGIGSLIALGLFAPFALHMFRRFVSITESFQR